MDRPSPWNEKKDVYESFAFRKKDWEQCGAADLVAEEDETAEISSLPDDIAAILDSPCPVFSEKKVKETHMLYRIPRGLSFNKIGQIAQAYFPDTDDGYEQTRPPLFYAIGDKIVEKSYWALMTMDTLPKSWGKKFKEQQEMVAELPNYEPIPIKIFHSLSELFSL